MNKPASLGKLIILKFFENTNPDNSGRLISKTAGKCAFLSKSHKGPIPRDKEFWRCRIVDEIFPSERRGCLVVEPINHVLETDLERLLPGFYTDEMIDGTLFIYPKMKGNFLLPLAHKKSLTGIVSCLVCLQEEDTSLQSPSE